MAASRIAAVVGSVANLGPKDIAGYVAVARCAAVRDGKGLRAALDSLADPLEVIARELVRHQLLPTALATLRDAEDQLWVPRLEGVVQGLEPRHRNWSQAVLAGFAEVSGALRSAGVEALVLKGPILAVRLYGGLERRPQADLDILVMRARRRDAERALRAIGYERARRDQHAFVLRRGDARVDLHWAIRSAPAYRFDEPSIWRDCPAAEVMGVPVRTLSDEYLLALLSVGLAEDAGIGMVKLKQLIDLWLLARELDDRLAWDAWFERRQPERIDEVAAAGLWLMLAATRGATEMPHLAAALGARTRRDGRDAAPQRALDLLAAPRHDPASRRWFADAYPGSLAVLRLHSLAAGLPHSLLEARLLRGLRRSAVPARAGR